jgi:hypothetical protein
MSEYQWPGEHQCLWCREPLRPGVLSEVEVFTPVGIRRQHVECAVRSVVGGLNHLNGRCSCCGGTLPPDPVGLSTREAARMAYQVWRARNP